MTWPISGKPAGWNRSNPEAGSRVAWMERQARDPHHSVRWTGQGDDQSWVSSSLFPGFVWRSPTTENGKDLLVTNRNDQRSQQTDWIRSLGGDSEIGQLHASGAVCRQRNIHRGVHVATPQHRDDTAEASTGRCCLPPNVALSENLAEQPVARERAEQRVERQRAVNRRPSAGETALQFPSRLAVCLACPVEHAESIQPSSDSPFVCFPNQPSVHVVEVHSDRSAEWWSWSRFPQSLHHPPLRHRTQILG